MQCKSKQVNASGYDCAPVQPLLQPACPHMGHFQLNPVEYHPFPLPVLADQSVDGRVDDNEHTQVSSQCRRVLPVEDSDVGKPCSHAFHTVCKLPIPVSKLSAPHRLPRSYLLDCHRSSLDGVGLYTIAIKSLSLANLTTKYAGWEYSVGECPLLSLVWKLETLWDLGFVTLEELPNQGLHTGILWPVYRYWVW